MMNQGLRCYKTILIVVFLLQRIFLFGQPSIVGIDTTEVVKIGGISQVLKMKSKDVGKPILLYLHGASYKSYSVISDIDRLTSRLQEHFLVVLWDQREYGKTYELNSSPVPLTIKLIVGDTKEVIDYLLQKFQRKKLFLAGHSMGSVEGIHIATENPEKLFAFIAMSPAVYGIKSQKMGLEMLREHFALVNNRRATNELAQIKLPARDFESLFIKYVWQSEYDGEHMSDSVREAIKPSLKMWMETSSAALSNEIFEMNFFRLLTDEEYMLKLEKLALEKRKKYFDLDDNELDFPANSDLIDNEKILAFNFRQSNNDEGVIRIGYKKTWVFT